MASYNRVILMGNLTRDPELRKTPGDASVVELRLAVNEVFVRKSTQEKVERTCFVDVVVWQRQAELCQQYLSKGSPVLVEGRLEYDEWKNPQGETRNKLRVRADRVQFIGSPRTGGPEHASAGHSSSRPTPTPTPAPASATASAPTVAESTHTNEPSPDAWGDAGETWNEDPPF